MLTYITNVVRATTSLGDKLLFSDVCHQALTLKPLVAQLYVIVQLFALRALSCYKHDMGTLLLDCANITVLSILSVLQLGMRLICGHSFRNNQYSSAERA